MRPGHVQPLGEAAQAERRGRRRPGNRGGVVGADEGGEQRVAAIPAGEMQHPGERRDERPVPQHMGRRPADEFPEPAGPVESCRAARIATRDGVHGDDEQAPGPADLGHQGRRGLQAFHACIIRIRHRRDEPPGLQGRHETGRLPVAQSDHRLERRQGRTGAAMVAPRVVVVDQHERDHVAPDLIEQLVTRPNNLRRLDHPLAVTGDRPTEIALRPKQSDPVPKMIVQHPRLAAAGSMPSGCPAQPRRSSISCKIWTPRGRSAGDTIRSARPAAAGTSGSPGSAGKDDEGDRQACAICIDPPSHGDSHGAAC